jgi:hypothetical protein
MIARGKRRAQRDAPPLGRKHNERQALKERNNCHDISHFQCFLQLISGDQGKRRAQRGASPLVSEYKLTRALKVRNIIADYSALSELHAHCAFTRGDALRDAQRLPLAIIFRAFGALQTELRLLCKVMNRRRTHPLPRGGTDCTQRSKLELESELDRAWAANLVERIESSIGAA